MGGQDGQEYSSTKRTLWKCLLPHQAALFTPTLLLHLLPPQLLLPHTPPRGSQDGRFELLLLPPPLLLLLIPQLLLLLLPPPLLLHSVPLAPTPPPLSAKKDYQLLCKLTGHSGSIDSLDWTLPITMPGSRLNGSWLLMASDQSSNLLFWDPQRGA